VCSGVCVGGLQGGWRGLENDRQYWNLWTTTVWSNGLLIRMEQEQGHREWGSDGVSRIKVLYAHVWTPPPAPLPEPINICFNLWRTGRKTGLVQGWVAVEGGGY
jgi:hypothetical protein